MTQNFRRSTMNSIHRVAKTSVLQQSLASRRRFLRTLSAIGVGMVAPMAISGYAEEGKLPVTGKANADLASFDRMMETFVEQHKVPGAALAISRHGKLI